MLQKSFKLKIVFDTIKQSSSNKIDRRLTYQFYFEL